MGTIQRYYFDKDCNRIDAIYQNDYLETHNEIARRIINNNQEFLDEYNEIGKKGIISESVYLVMKGYIYVGGSNQYNMSAMYSSISLNKNTKSIMTHIKEDGYYTYDIIRSELTDEQKEQVRAWAKEGMNRNQIINKVMTDMLTLLAPVQNVNKKEDLDYER